MCDLQTIERLLRGESPDAREAVGRACLNYSTALFAVRRPESGRPLELAGSGTLITIQNEYYILTAAHVWAERLRQADAVGLTLREHHDHEFLIPINLIVVSLLRRPETWGEAGPDIALLRIPPERARAIMAFRVFYRLPDARNFNHIGDHLEASVLIGTPHELGAFEPNHADLEFRGFFMNEPTNPQTADDFDYVDVQADLNIPGVPQSFGGVSGGGLWKALIYCSGPTHRIETSEILSGVAYYQFPPADGHSVIRCHGSHSLQTVANLVQSS